MWASQIREETTYNNGEGKNSGAGFEGGKRKCYARQEKVIFFNLFF